MEKSKKNSTNPFHLMWYWVKAQCLKFDARVDHTLSYFIKHWGKTRFMIAMSKRLQHQGFEKLLLKSPKAFFYFFMFYLIRDTILYIIIPIWIASVTD